MRPGPIDWAGREEWQFPADACAARCAIASKQSPSRREPAGVACASSSGREAPPSNVAFPSEAFDIEGTFSDFASEADSGNVMHRRFCPKCGTHVFPSPKCVPISCRCRRARSMSGDW